MDLVDENIIQYFPETYEFIKNALAGKGRVLVHCQAGVSRSPTIVAAYIMREKQLSAQQALDIIKLRRSFIEPNRGFMEQLDLYHELRYNVDQTEAAYRRFLVAANAKAQQGKKKRKILEDRETPDESLLRCVVRTWIHTKLGVISRS